MHLKLLKKAAGKLVKILLKSVVAEFKLWKLRRQLLHIQ